MSTAVVGVGRVYITVCVRLCVFQYDISNISAARIDRLVVEMFHDESWKLIYFGVRRSKVKVMSHQTSVMHLDRQLSLNPYR